MPGPEFSVVVPVYNSEASLRELHARLARVFQSSLRKTFELILVDDGSRDASWEVMQSLAQHDGRVKSIRLWRNFGQHNALFCGFHFCQGQIIITLDDDLQNPPEELPKLIRKLREGYDLAMGVQVKKQHAWYRNLGSALVNGLYARIFGKPSELRFTNFRVFTRQVCQRIIQHARPPQLFLGAEFLLCLPHSQIANVSVRHEPRKYGRSQYTSHGLYALAGNLLINYSAIPLHAGIYLGLGLSLLALGYAVWIIARVMVSGTVRIAGWASLSVLISFFFGILFCFLGILGEYLHRVLLVVQQPENPFHFIREIGGAAQPRLQSGRPLRASRYGQRKEKA